MKIWPIVFTLLWLPAAQANLGKLRYLSEEYPPYNYTNSQGAPAGLAVDLLKAVWQLTGTEPQPITMLPWARGYYLLTMQPDVVLFSTARTKARDPLFKWACTIGHIEIVLMAMKDRHIHLDSLDDAKGRTITAVRADVGEQLLLNNGFDEDHVLSANRLSQALKMITSGRTELISADKVSLIDQIRHQRLPLQQFEQVWTLSSEPLCFAFSARVDDAWVKQFQLALDQVQASSDYPALYLRYFPKP